MKALMKKLQKPSGLAALGAGTIAAWWLMAKKQAQPASGLGFFWIWRKDFYTVAVGSKWLAPRYLTSSAASEWYLDTMENNWNESVKQYRKDGNSWKKIAG